MLGKKLGRPDERKKAILDNPDYYIPIHVKAVNFLPMWDEVI